DYYCVVWHNNGVFF
nr:immunoglobulin light chain junction region [Macaca mulatta]MOV98465.1 immunoglobulin light chain junction region [Macaca mulatta]